MAWYNKKLKNEWQVNRDVETCLNKEMGQIEELHEKESQIWNGVKAIYEEVATANICKILKPQEMS